MSTYGLTGGIGSGKSAVAEEFRALGIDVLDADAVARNVVAIGSPALDEITKHFGDNSLNLDRSLNRAHLRSIIFSNSIEKKWLESLLHPLIRNQITQHLAKQLLPYQILESPLLLETNQSQLVDKIIVVDVDRKTQIARASQRDAVSMDQIEQIINSQMPRAERLGKADFIIDNSDSLSELPLKVLQLHEMLKQLSGGR